MPADTPIEPGAPAKPPRLEIVQADDSHAAGIAEFIRAVWTPSATTESVLASRIEGAARNEAEPGVAPPTWLAVRAGRVLGYVTTIPVRWWDGEQAVPAYWIKGLMVLPEFRNGPIGFSVMKAAAARLPRSAGLAVALPARRLFGALGYRDLGAIPNWIRPLAPGRIVGRLDFDLLTGAGIPAWARPVIQIGRATGLAALFGWLGGVALRAAAAARRLPLQDLATGPVDPPEASAEVSALWARVRAGFPSGVVRDAQYLRHRYPAGPQEPYRWIAVRERDGLAGIAILRRPRDDGDPRLRGVRVATLVDMLYHPGHPRTGLALLGAVEAEARALGADAILATCSAPALAGVLRRQFYFPLSGNVHFLVRDVTGDRTTFGEGLTDWWLTRGDGNSDEVF